VANLRQNMQFLYVQDDVRVSDKLTLNLGMRYEYATPHWEKDNILSNWDPETRRMIQAKDGSMYDRAWLIPIATIGGRGWGLPTPLRRERFCVAGGASVTCISIVPAAAISCRSTALR
jgi:hypothetical protein